MKTPTRSASLVGGLVILMLAVLAPVAQRGPAPPAWPGALGQGVTLLPNGWKIAPAGRHLQIGDLPLAMVQSPDGRYLIVTQQRLREADADGRRPQERLREGEGRDRARVARPRLAPRRPAAVLVGGEPEHRQRVRLNPPTAR